MAALLANSVRHRIAVGSNVGHGVVRLGDQIDGDSLDAFQSPRCAMVSGFSVHANVGTPATTSRLAIETVGRSKLDRPYLQGNAIWFGIATFVNDASLAGSWLAT